VEVGHTVADQGIRRDLLEVVAVGHTGLVEVPVDHSLVEVRQAEHHILEADADQAEHRNPGVAAVHSLAAAVGRSPEVVVGRSLGEARHIGRVVRRSRQVPG
jgi:hypothetical protein